MSDLITFLFWKGVESIAVFRNYIAKKKTNGTYFVKKIKFDKVQVKTETGQIRSNKK